jgi:hypothetical protein
MKDLGKWIYRILIVLLADMLIDFNCFNRKPSPEQSHHILLANLVLGGLLFLLLISQIKKRRL